MKYNTKNFGYVTSFIGLVTFLWQLNYIGVEESLFYTTTLGCYFLALGFSRMLVKDYENQNILTVVGFGILLLPPIASSFTYEGMKYSLFLGTTGIILTALAISLEDTKYKYAGITGIVFAVLPQTYNYILSLPRWIVVGLVGFIFIATAIFLLLKRSDDHKKD